MTNNKTTSSIDLSIIITVHAEGILLHKTLASVRRALNPLHAAGAQTEIIIHVDNATPETQTYLRAHKANLEGTHVYHNTFGDLGSSRNFAVSKAVGRYVTFIDADDLMSEKWLVRAYKFLEKHPRGEYVAHTESTVEFGSADSVVIKHGEINQATDTLLLVFSNRWNSIIMAPRELLNEEKYVANSPGYGYEDWQLNTRFVLRGIHNVLIPETAIFVRRKDANSEWLRQIVSRSVLRATPLFRFSNIRNLALAASDAPEGKGDKVSAVVLPLSRKQQLKARLRPLLTRAPLAERAARKLYRMYRASPAPQMVEGAMAEQKRLPDWLVSEWRALHAIEKLLFPSDELVRSVKIYDSLTPEHYQTGEAFKKMIDHTSHDEYGYILFVPWITTGGADLVTIHLTTALRKARPDKNILVVATLPTASPWASKLPEGVDFIPFGQITDGLSQDVQFRLLEQLVENSGAQFLHTLNSALAYDFFTSHEKYIKATDKKIIATSFSQSVDGTGRVFGYSHTHVPQIYEMATAITTDNQAVVNMWTNEYGFDPARLIVHHTPLAIPKVEIPKRPVNEGHLRVFWGARLSPEKIPQVAVEVGRLVQDLPITIDMYGPADHGFDQSFLESLPPNVHYKGPHNGFWTLPLHEYDAMLYTSLFDGMPISILEASAARLAIVSTAVGGIPDFIEHKKNGLLVQDPYDVRAYADGLKQLLENPKLMNTYSERLFERLQELHTEKAYRNEIAAFAKRIGY
jgi:glycosyltransferase involved in cell wall biosynthesis